MTRKKAIRAHLTEMRKTNPAATYMQAAADLGVETPVEWVLPTDTTSADQPLLLTRYPDGKNLDGNGDIHLPADLLNLNARAAGPGQHLAIVASTGQMEANMQMMPVEEETQPQSNRGRIRCQMLLNTVRNELRAAITENEHLADAVFEIGFDPTFSATLTDTATWDPEEAPDTWDTIRDTAEEYPEARIIVLLNGFSEPWVPEGVEKTIHECPNITTIGIAYNGDFTPWSEKGRSLHGRRPLRELTLRSTDGAHRPDGTLLPYDAFEVEGDLYRYFGSTGSAVDDDADLVPVTAEGYLGTYDQWRTALPTQNHLWLTEPLLQFPPLDLTRSGIHLITWSDQSMYDNILVVTDIAECDLFEDVILGNNGLRLMPVYVVVDGTDSPQRAAFIERLRECIDMMDAEYDRPAPLVFSTDPAVFTALDIGMWTLPESA